MAAAYVHDSMATEGGERVARRQREHVGELGRRRAQMGLYQRHRSHGLDEAAISHKEWRVVTSGNIIVSEWDYAGMP